MWYLVNKGVHNTGVETEMTERARREENIPRADMVCKNCWYWSDEFTSVCVNDMSINRGDFVNKNMTCDCFDLDERRYTGSGK